MKGEMMVVLQGCAW